MPSNLRTFRLGTKRTRVSKLLPHSFETETKLYRNPGGKGLHTQHIPQRPPSLKGIVDTMKQVKTPTFSIRVLGKLQETPENYPEDEYPAYEWLYLGNVRATAPALADARSKLAQHGNDWYQMREWVNDWSNFKWSEIATVFISER